MKLKLATCTSTLPDGAPTVIKLIPMGDIVAADGRKWTLTDAEAVVAASAAGIDLVIDYGHQTDLAQKNGQPAPAAGWISKLEARADGIYGQVEWTEKAKAHLEGKEYRYLSPTFYHDKAGNVLRIVRAALTNNPAIHELPALAEAQDEGNQIMDEEQFLALCQALGLPEDTAVDKVIAAAKALKAGEAAAGADGETVKAVCSALDLGDNAKAEDITQAITGLKDGAQPDPKEFVSMASYRDLSGQLDALQKQVNGDKAADAVEKAMASGKVTPAQKSWALSFASKDLKGFNEFLETQPVIVAPGSAMSGDTPAKASALDAEQKALCSAMGISEDDFLNTMNEGTA
ncbi:MAG: phage protease [Alphaproteobacteria bacterium]|nr:phage protease [Alphaproteobacteria bacterium]